MHTEITFTIIDGAGKRSVWGLWFAASVALADLQTWVPSMKTLIDGIIDGAVEEIRISHAIQYQDIASANSDVNEGALFYWAVENNGSMEDFIPTFQESLMIPGSDRVNLSDPDVAAFVTAVVDGIGGIAPTDWHENSVTGCESAVEKFKQRKKR